MQVIRLRSTSNQTVCGGSLHPIGRTTDGASAPDAYMENVEGWVGFNSEARTTGSDVTDSDSLIVTYVQPSRANRKRPIFSVVLPRALVCDVLQNFEAQARITGNDVTDSDWLIVAYVQPSRANRRRYWIKPSFNHRKKGRFRWPTMMRKMGVTERTNPPTTGEPNTKM